LTAKAFNVDYYATEIPQTGVMMATDKIEVGKAAAFKPYIAAKEVIKEMTPRALILGAFFGIIFGASSVYLALKVGLTVSASVPIAVLSITVLRLFGRATILENNIVQTTGSAGESIAAGIVFTLPALLILGLDLDISRTSLLIDCPHGRLAGNLADDSIAPLIDCQRAWQSSLSRRHRLCRGPRSWREGRHGCAHRLYRLRYRLRL
jgi:hypothetical protein